MFDGFVEIDCCVLVIEFVVCMTEVGWLELLDMRPDVLKITCFVVIGWFGVVRGAFVTGCSDDCWLLCPKL